MYKIHFQIYIFIIIKKYQKLFNWSIDLSTEKLKELGCFYLGYKELLSLFSLH